MKKILLLLFMILCFVLVGCDEDESHTDNETPTNTEVNTVDTITMPVLSIDEFGNVTWDAVNGATHYNYIINNDEILSTTSLCVQLSNEQAISVQAANDEMVSDWSYAVTYYDTTRYEEKVEGHFKTLSIELKYDENNKPVITNLKRVSKPGLRNYCKAKNLPQVLGGLGVAVVSTSKGLLTDRKARKENLGGEVLAYIY